MEVQRQDFGLNFENNSKIRIFYNLNFQINKFKILENLLVFENYVTFLKISLFSNY